MGCGVSMPITDEQTTPATSNGVRPIRRWKTKGRTGSTPLKNENPVRVEKPEEADDGDSHISPKSLVHDQIIHKNTKDNLGSAQESSSMPPEKETGKISDVKPLPSPLPAPAQKEKKGEENEKQEEEDEEENGYGFIDGPGSPSFREYYVNSGTNSADLTDKSKEEGAKIEKKTQRTESIASSEGSINQLTKKQSKGRRFIRALPKGLNVRSCYTPPCTSSHDNPQEQQLLNAEVVHAS